MHLKSKKARRYVVLNERESERASKCRYSFTNDFNLELFENTASTPWHIHNCIELIYILEGNCIINTDHPSFASAGDVILIFNDVPHYTDCFENVHYTLHFGSTVCEEFSDMTDRYVPIDPVIKADSLPGDFRMLFEGLYAESEQNRKSQNPMKAIGAPCLSEKYYVKLLFSKLIPLIRLKDSPPERHGLQKEIINYCHGNYRNRITLDTVAKAVHADKYTVSNIINRDMRTNFCEFVNRLRVRYACDLLQFTDMSVTDVAYEVGFSSLSTFNRTFKSMIGKPLEYKKKYGVKTESTDGK